ncbi:bacteriorhodopsin-like [Mesohalobacter halotolerans]|jgi:bacteriorhodopsin|uniref:Rhodopsin n=1 Tax=Mesohalobacter halotolerans TaxID=1883405 RepID=A0A4U5TRE5_9FLAO|nr:bacteriorhodopsin-like [Mesohalobacter halotolerans]MBS3739160.1 bacteriorhodopsin [Psychroflexus sp.]NBC58207.1 bacteriorhodopsin [Bacteroidota bacterium]TKS55954.1 rhodopsin [Mesohalobacter halotolerans]
MRTLLFLSEMSKIANDDYVGFTFFVGSMAMMAASAFFFLSLSQFDKKWRTSVLVSGLITFIAAVHYFYMRDYWDAVQESPTFFRYVDWVLTVPLMCVEFFLILRAAGAKKSLMWKLIFWSVVMLVTGYFGEAIAIGNPTMQWVWGLISGIAYFVIVYIVWFGEAKKLAVSAGGSVLTAHKILCWFVLVGWAIYPLGYILGTEGGLFGVQLVSDIDAAQQAMNVVYNIGDAVNKIGFGLVVFSLAVSSTSKS